MAASTLATWREKRRSEKEIAENFHYADLETGKDFEVPFYIKVPYIKNNEDARTALKEVKGRWDAENRSWYLPSTCNPLDAMKAIATVADFAKTDFDKIWPEEFKLDRDTKRMADMVFITKNNHSPIFFKGDMTLIDDLKEKYAKAYERDYSKRLDEIKELIGQPVVAEETASQDNEQISEAPAEEKPMKTLLQWGTIGKYPIDVENGGTLFQGVAKDGRAYSVIKYTEEAVRDITVEEDKQLKAEHKSYRPFYEENRANKPAKKKSYNRPTEYKKVIDTEPVAGKERPYTWIKDALEKTPVGDVPANMTPTICFDVESTGFRPGYGDKQDELLQIAIVNDKGEEIFSSLIQPYNHSEWPEAMSKNNITPEMVAHAPLPHEIAPKLRDIFAAAENIVGYNVDFDIKFVSVCLQLNLVGKTRIDPMVQFVKDVPQTPSAHHKLEDAIINYCGENSDVHESYKANAHKADCDAVATLEVYHALEKEKEFLKDMASITKDANQVDDSIVNDSLQKMAPVGELRFFCKAPDRDAVELTDVDAFTKWAAMLNAPDSQYLPANKWEFEIKGEIEDDKGEISLKTLFIGKMDSITLPGILAAGKGHTAALNTTKKEVEEVKEDIKTEESVEDKSSQKSSVTLASIAEDNLADLPITDLSDEAEEEEILIE
jgi:DNA polymerase-3 subunit epsilon